MTSYTAAPSLFIGQVGLRRVVCSHCRFKHWRHMESLFKETTNPWSDERNRTRSHLEFWKIMEFSENIHKHKKGMWSSSSCTGATQTRTRVVCWTSGTRQSKTLKRPINIGATTIIQKKQKNLGHMVMEIYFCFFKPLKIMFSFLQASFLRSKWIWWHSEKLSAYLFVQTN